MLKASQLAGILPAMPTPVRADGSIDEVAARALVGHLLTGGVDGMLPLGGTGEYGALSRGARNTMAAVCAEAVSGKIPVIAGVLDPGYHDALATAHDFASAGVDALLVVTPYYTNPTQAGLRDYFLRFADESPLPILLYEIPYRTRIALDPEVTHLLSRHERIIGMKVCNIDMYHFLRTMAGVDADFAVLSGEDSLFPLHVAAGAHGGIVVTASLLPRTWRRMFDLASQGRTQDALLLHRKLIPLINLAFAETNPGPLKSVLDLIGVDAPVVLTPLNQPASDLQARLRSEVEYLLGVCENA
ncbi:4-hydroxy-tetrahydrodipicolinate synthase [Aminobacter lissarensis]|uniref:4-hydroxy-tetrahydrodipicolinate synthase n=1 Tax=Aminobacter carboxidus TaxID=376165 RepID=A0A8E1WJD9_9HYPH|nr:4-hydroxy-tetrahydrodipicolinate synthase [Aminobacter lissarensis]MBB6468446.1 4-hydroxy-tetrahydrodipicolinate synthase [Aminobacter lissarensis]